MSSAEYQRLRYKKQKSKGLCTRGKCTEKPVCGGLCEFHWEKHKQNRKRYEGGRLKTFVFTWK